MSFVEKSRNEIRRDAEKLQNENELMKTYLSRLPSEIEFEKVRETLKIYEEKLKNAEETIEELREEKFRLKTRLKLVEEERREIPKTNVQIDSTKFNTKILSIDERREKEKQIEILTKNLHELQMKIDEEKLEEKRQKNLQEQNEKTLEFLSMNVAEKEEKIRHLTSLLRQVNSIE